jgi:hypothetical protein
LYVGEGLQRALKVEVPDPGIDPVEGADQGETAGDDSGTLLGVHAVEGEAPGEDRVGPEYELRGAPLGGLRDHG